MLCYVGYGAASCYGYVFYSCLELNGVTGICNVKDTGRDGNDKKRNNLHFQDKSIVAHVLIYINCV